MNLTKPHSSSAFQGKSSLPQRSSGKILPTNRGLGLVELMISIGLGAFVLLGLMSFVGTSNRNFVATTSLARMQETGRLAVDLLGNEIRRSGFWAGINYDESLTEVVGGSLAITGPDVTCPEIASGLRFATALDVSLHGTNNMNTGYDCLTGPVGPDQYLRGDVLTVRYASSDGIAAVTNDDVFLRLAPFEGRLFVGADSLEPENEVIDPAARVHRLNAHSYFVGESGRSCAGEPIPSLFRVALNDTNGSPVIQELLPGVEELQVQFLENTRYLNADQVGDWADVTAVQLWILVRSECPEQDLTLLQPNLPDLDLGDIQYAQTDGRYRRKVFRQVFARRNMIGN